MQVVSVEVIFCDHLQAPAASRATREPLDRRVSQVGRQSYHSILQDLVPCFGLVIDASDEW